MRSIITMLNSELLTWCCAISYMICIYSTSTQTRWAASWECANQGHYLVPLCVQSKLHFDSIEDQDGRHTVRGAIAKLLPRLTDSIWFSLSTMLASVWYWYCAIMWKYTLVHTNNRASLMGILFLAERCKSASTQSGMIPCQNTLTFLTLQWLSWQYGLPNYAKAGYGGIMTKSLMNLSIHKCCFTMEVTQSIKYSGMLTSMLWSTLHTLTVVGEMHVIFHMTPSDFDSTKCFSYCLAMGLLVLCLWQRRIIVGTARRYDHNWHNDEVLEQNKHIGALHTGSWCCLIECNWMFSNECAIHTQIKGLYCTIWLSVQGIPFAGLVMVSRVTSVRLKANLQTSQLLN